MVWLRRSLSVLLVMMIVAGIVYSFRPQPIDVDWSVIARGSLEVTVNEDGRSRVREKYTVSTPLAGQLQRIVLNPGDEVVPGETLLATILPSEPGLLDPRERNSAEARVKMAESGVERSQANATAAQVAYGHAKSVLERRIRLRQEQASGDQEVEDAEMLSKMRAEELRSAEFAREIARFELDLAQAALIRTRPGDESAGQSWHLDIVAPIQGRVLRLFQESVSVLPAGTPFMEIGNANDLELEVDVLSTDAVKIRAGAKMAIEHWGGETVLEARVRLVEPGAFTKVSALGVEEQRVNVIGDFVSPPPTNFGDRYRFEARIVVWSGDDLLKVPMSALFRQGQDWAVFVINPTDLAERRIVQIGHRNADEAEVLGGLQEQERVVIFPSDQVTDQKLLKLKVK